jgi:hypothetical protein
VLSLGPLSFAEPLALSGLVALAVIWWLLRLKPPAPTRVQFPAVRILAGLTDRRDSPALTPWWLLILRLLLATLIILAIAHPLWDTGKGFSNKGPVYLIVDDNWSAANRWSSKQKMMLGLIDQAEREGRSMIILKTAARPSHGAREPVAAITPAQARRIINGLLPRPWPLKRTAAVEQLLSAPFLKEERPGDIVWFSDGLKSKNDDMSALLKRLQRIGAVSVVSETRDNLPLILRAPEFNNGKMTIRVERAAAPRARGVTIQGFDEDGNPLVRHPVFFGAEETTAETSVKLPAEIYNRIARLDVEGSDTVGGVILMDERWRRRPVGVPSSTGSEKAQPLLTPTHYLERALEPFSEVRKGQISELLGMPLSVITITETAVLSENDRISMSKWIENGGTVVRFAGPSISGMTLENDTLLPVKLRQGNREIGGAMSWSKPAKLAPFPDNSPFYGLTISPDIEVRKQVLARPSPELAEKTWARLSDGTPLITAERRGEGRIVLIHTTANLDWSNLAISGLFVDMLRRIVDLSQGVVESDDEALLSPVLLLDAFAQLQEPVGVVKSIAISRFDDMPVSADHPPGYYGAKTFRRAHNISPKIEALTALEDLPNTVEQRNYDAVLETDFRPGLLMAALILFLVDTLISQVLRSGRMLARIQAGAVALLAICIISDHAEADALSFARENSLETRLAYVISGNTETDNISRLGLIGLTTILAQRTAAELGPPQGINPAFDDLSFFPLLYWPLSEDLAVDDTLLSERIRTYMKNGGTILFDTKAEGLGGSGSMRRLRGFASELGLPQLIPVSSDHVLGRAFYLIKSFPGRWTGGTLWIERAGKRVNDGVSPVIVGSHDWASAWAVDESGRPMFPVVPGGEAQRELAYRFGINLVMYTLTGNYKADQVHLPAIMQRLGQ